MFQEAQEQIVSLDAERVELDGIFVCLYWWGKTMWKTIIALPKSQSVPSEEAPITL